jgi:hypothetical protein
MTMSRARVAGYRRVQSRLHGPRRAHTVPATHEAPGARLRGRSRRDPPSTYRSGWRAGTTGRSPTTWRRSGARLSTGCSACPGPAPRWTVAGGCGKISPPVFASKGLSVGRATYGEYSDADSALASATWCAVRHLRPSKVLETGVARESQAAWSWRRCPTTAPGISGAWTCPNPFAPELHSQTAAAVPGGSMNAGLTCGDLSGRGCRGSRPD